ncbi:MAG: hypothetical protein JO257_37295 [Deltaproteobacteria bacterium]|nr:hypothetical protein [Deltaproteobacteria bacterium]
MAVTAKKVLNAAGTVLVVAGLLLIAYLKWWNMFGQKGLGGACNSRAGCRTYWCLKHDFAGSAERVSSGYCTDKCSADGDCDPGMRCVVPTAAALDDLPSLGRPSRLCERLEK